MRRSSLTTLALGVFGLILLSFVIRGFGQLVIGSHSATIVAGPVAVAAAGLLVVVLCLWLLDKLGLIHLAE